MKEKMVGNVASLLHTDVGLVNVKARTHEKVDSVGECRAIGHVVLTWRGEATRWRSGGSGPTPREVTRSLPGLLGRAGGGVTQERNGRLEIDAGRTFR